MNFPGPREESGLHPSPVACRSLLAVIFMLAASTLQAQSFDKGKELYLFNKPAEAAVFFEQSTSENPDNQLAWLYLGICRQQLGQYEKAVIAFKSGLDRGAPEPHVFWFNLGNTYQLSGSADDARRCFLKAAELSPGFARTYVNLGNLEVQQVRYPDAIKSYRLFIAHAPDDSLVPDVARMIGLLEDELHAQELAMKAEEDRKAQEAFQKAEDEKRRLAKEEADRIAEEKRKQLMASVFDSLNDLPGGGDTLSAGNEDVRETQDSLEREN